jgi:hypothetical protein
LYLGRPIDDTYYDCRSVSGVAVFDGCQNLGRGGDVTTKHDDRERSRWERRRRIAVGFTGAKR